MDSTQMIMVIWEQLKTTHIITLDNYSYFNFPLKKVQGSALDQVLLLALRGAGHQPDGLSGLETWASHQVNDPQEVLFMPFCPKTNPQGIKVQIQGKS